MFTVIFIICLRVALSASDEGDLGYSLNIGNAINVFANYGDLSQVSQVISADYDDEEDEELPEPFSEKNIKVFLNASSRETPGKGGVDLNILLFETFDDLLDGYFQNFHIEGTDKPWKAFMGDWIQDEIMRTLGIEYDARFDCCFVLLKISKVNKTVQIDSLDNVAVKSYVEKAVNGLNIADVAAIRNFTRSYGTHYIDSYTTGNFVYQVFKFKRYGYNMLRAYVRGRQHHNNSDRLRFYFASNFLNQVGDIRIASGNKSIETWAKAHLRDSQYLFYRPSLLRLYNNNVLFLALNRMLDDGALLGLSLKTLAPLFKDEEKRKRYVEVVENDLQLWEVNA